MGCKQKVAITYLQNHNKVDAVPWIACVMHTDQTTLETTRHSKQLICESGVAQLNQLQFLLSKNSFNSSSSKLHGGLALILSPLV